MNLPATRTPLLRLDVFSQRCGIHPDLIRRFVVLGLVEPEVRRNDTFWFSPVQVLKMGTSNAGKWLMATGPKNPYKEHQLGLIEEGAYADLILVQGDPTQDVAVLADYDANINFVMKDGKVFKNSMK